MNKMKHIYTLERMKTWSKDLSDDEIEAIAYALKSLNQEPCEDAVSRQAVLKAIKEWWQTAMDADGNPSLCDDIIALSPMQPKRKQGKCKWILYDYRTIAPEEHDIDNPYWRIPERYSEVLKYCPYCGKEIDYSEIERDMRGTEE